MSNRPPYNRGKRPTRDHVNYDSVNDGQRSKHDGKLNDSHSKFRTPNDRSPARGHGRYGHDRGAKEGRPTSGRGRDRDRDDGPPKRRDPLDRDRDRTIYSRGGGGKNDVYSHSHGHRSSDRGSGEISPRQNGSGHPPSDLGYGINSGMGSREYVSSDFKRQTGMHALHSVSICGLVASLVYPNSK